MKVFGQIIFLIWISNAYMFLKRPYEVRFISWRSTGPLMDVKCRILGRDRRINGTIELMEDIQDDRITFGVDSYLDSFGNGNYKHLPMSLSNNSACQTIKANIKLFIPTLDYGVNTNIPVTNITDPVPKGLYYFKDILVKPDNWPMIMPRGFMKLLLYFNKGEQIVSSHDIEVQLLDRLV